MNKELDEKLCKEFPSIFRNRHGDKTQTCMHWGFECGDGWYNIIRGLCLSLTYSYTTSKDLRLDGKVLPEGMDYKHPEFNSYFWRYEGVGDVVAEQVKEKFGTLRFYYSHGFKPDEEKMAELYPNTAKVISEERWRYTEGVVRMAEAMSGITCEMTGLPGELHSTGGRGGWVKTLNVEFAKNDEWCKSRGYAPYHS
jgi:hypothetical protein